MTRDEISATLKDLYKAVQLKLEYAYERWQDEKDYEDIQSYGALFSTICTSKGAKFLKMTKRPFGFQADIGGHKVQYGCTQTRTYARSVK